AAAISARISALFHLNRRRTRTPPMGDTAPTRIAILSDDRLYADGLRHFLGSDSTLIPITVPPAPRLAATLRAIDPSLAVVGGAPESLELCSMIVTGCGLPVVMVSVPDETAAVRALTSGARGIVYRRDPPDQIACAVRLVHDGGVWAPRSIIVAAFEQLRVKV